MPWSIEGRLLCWQTGESSWIEWTHPELLIGASMRRADLDAEALVADWRDAGLQ